MMRGGENWWGIRLQPAYRFQGRDTSPQPRKGGGGRISLKKPEGVRSQGRGGGKLRDGSKEGKDHR